MPYSDDQIKSIIEQTTSAAVNAAVNAVVNAERERDARVDEQLEKHEHLLYGNGKEGLITKIDRIEQLVKPVSSIGWRILEVLTISIVLGAIILIVQNGLLR